MGRMRYLVDIGRFGELIRRNMWCLYSTRTLSVRKGGWKKNRISTANLKDKTWMNRTNNWTGDVSFLML